MTTKELIYLLLKYPEDTKIQFVASYKDSCSCDPQFCYCSWEDHYYDVDGVSDRTEFVIEKKGRKLIGACITGSQ